MTPVVGLYVFDGDMRHPRFGTATSATNLAAFFLVPTGAFGSNDGLQYGKIYRSQDDSLPGHEMPGRKLHIHF